jgi:Protein of unknown function (DUF3352)
VTPLMTRHARRFGLKGLPALAVLWCASLALAQDRGQAVRPLVGLVGRDAGLVVEVSQLAEQLPAVARSPLLDRLKDLELYQRWLVSDDYRKLLATREQIESLLDTASLAQLVQDVFGESVVVAVYPAEGAEPAGILLTQASAPDVLARTLTAWNEAERAEVVPVRHGGIEYVKRTVPPADDAPESSPQTQFYVTLGSTLALSDNESAIQRTIELAGSNDPSASLASQPQYQTARQLLAESTVASAWVNPRAWEATAADADEAAVGVRAGVLRRKVESVIVGVRFEDGLVLEAVVSLEPASADDRWGEFVAQAAGSAEFLPRAPRSALLVLAGRTDFTRSEQLLAAQLPENERRQWELIKQLSPLLAIDVVNDVLPALGQNWALYVVPRDDPQAQVPVDVLFAFELASGPRIGDRSPARERLKRGLATAWDRLARFLSQGGERPQVKVESRMLGTTEIRSIAGLGPIAPAFALSEDRLVLGTAPTAAEDLLNLPETERLSAAPPFGAWHERYFAGRNPALYVNVEAVRDFVSRHRDVLTRRAADEGRLTPEAAAERLDRFDDLLKLVDAAFVTVELGERHIRVVVGGVVEEAPAAAAP